ncbi:MAG: hypothetical protein Q4E09_00410 [Eubacteriales bacterium]|nr:hypothetical protein [Eubacteriales bacterium]
MANTKQKHHNPRNAITITAALLALLFLAPLLGPAWQVSAMNAQQVDLSYEDTWRLQIQDLQAPLFSNSPLTDSKGNPRGPGIYNDAPGVSFAQSFMYIWDPDAYRSQLDQIYDPVSEEFVLSDDQVVALLPYPQDMYFMPVNNEYFAFRYVNPSPYPILNCNVELISRQHPERSLYIYNNNVVLPGQLSPLCLSELTLYDDDYNSYTADLDDLVFAGYSISYLDVDNGLVTLDYDPRQYTVRLTNYNDYYTDYQPANEEESEDYGEFMDHFFPKQDSLIITNTFDRDIIELYAILIGDNGAEFRLILPLAAGLRIPPGATVDLGDFLVWPGNIAFPGYDYIFVDQLELAFAGNDYYDGEDTYLFYLPALDLVTWDHFPDMGDFGEFTSVEDLLGDTTIAESIYLEPSSLIRENSETVPATSPRSTLPIVPQATEPPTRSTMPTVPQATEPPTRSTMPTVPLSYQENSNTESTEIDEEADPFALIEINLPQPGPELTAAEELGAMAVRSYMVARVYWQQLMDYPLEDPENFDAEEYAKLLDHANQAFDNAQRLADMFELASSNLAALEENPGYSSYAVPGSVDYTELGLDDASGLSPYRDIKLDNISRQILDLPAGGGASGQSLIFFSTKSSAEKKKAAEERQAALKWAQNVVDTFDHAKSGQKLKTVAAHLGTDCRRAFAVLKQANDMLTGAAYEEYEDYANTVYKAGVTAQAAGAVAQLGLSIACPPTTAIGKISLGVSTVSTTLTVGSAGATIYNNGNDNVVSKTLDSIQKRVGPVAEVFAITDLVSGGKNLLKHGQELLKGKNALEALKFLTTPEGSELARDAVMQGVSGLSYFTNEIMNYTGNKQLLSGVWTFTPQGLKFTLMDTLAGRDPAQAKAIKDELKAKGYDPEQLPASVLTGEEGNIAEPSDMDSIPPELGNKILERNSAYDPAAGILSQEEWANLVDALNQLIDQIYEEAAEELLAETPTAPETEISDERLASLIGRWRWDYIADGMLGDDAATYQEMTDLGMKLDFYFNLLPDGKMSMDYDFSMPFPVAGLDTIPERITRSIYNISTYEMKEALAHSRYELRGEDEIVFKTEGSDQEIVSHYSLDGDVLKWEYEGRTLTYVRVSDPVQASPAKSQPYNPAKPLLGTWSLDVLAFARSAGGEEIFAEMREYYDAGGVIAVYFSLLEDASVGVDYDYAPPIGVDANQQSHYNEIIRDLDLEGIVAAIVEAQAELSGVHYEYTGQNAGTISLYSEAGESIISLDYEVNADTLTLTGPGDQIIVCNRVQSN